MEIEWDALRLAALRAAAGAYAPYSGLSVGAAGVCTDGRIVRGCNVENASYGLTLCAECGLVSDLAATGGGLLVAVSVVAGDGTPLAPCGRCRQLLLEHASPEMVLDAGAGLEPVPLASLLPNAFTDGDLPAGRTAP